MHNIKLHILYRLQPEWRGMNHGNNNGGGDGGKQTHIPFQLKCLSVATRRTLLRPHTWACLSGRGFPLQVFSPPAVWGFCACRPKNDSQNAFSKIQQQTASWSTSSWPSRDLHNIISKHSLWSQPRPPSTAPRLDAHKCRHSLDLDFRLGIKYLTAARVPGSAPRPNLFINTNLFSVIKTQNFANEFTGGTPGVNTARVRLDEDFDVDLAVDEDGDWGCGSGLATCSL